MADCTCIDDLVITSGLQGTQRQAIDIYLSIPCFLPTWHVKAYSLCAEAPMASWIWKANVAASSIQMRTVSSS